MRIAGRDKLAEFCRTHADARRWIENWIAETELAQWKTPQDLKRLYSSASFPGGKQGKVVFLNVKGNYYRMELLVVYEIGLVIVRWLGTHAEYSKRAN